MRKSKRLLILALLCCVSLTTCGGKTTKPQPVIPPEPRLPQYSEEFNRTAPVKDLELMRDHEMDWRTVYQILRQQLEVR